MFYSEDIIEEVRTRNDIIDVISSYVNLKKKGSNYMGLCPFHSEKSPSFSVSGTKQIYHCFGCGVSGNIFTFIMEYENYTFVEAVKFLADRSGIKLPEAKMSEEEKRKLSIKANIMEINKIAATYYYCQLQDKKIGQIAHKYLKDRNLSEETIKSFGLGYARQNGGLYRYIKDKGYSDDILREAGLFTYDEKRGVLDKFWNRVIYPIMDINGKVIGFGGRVMGDGKPKYLNSPETKVFDKSRNLFGMNFARISKRKEIIICEGYMDVIALHQAGFDNAVASLGTAFTGLQANLLKRYTDNVLLTYDSDEAGVKAALRAIPILKEAGLTTKVVDMKPYKDPDEFIKALGSEEFEKRIEKATNSFFYETDIVKKNYDLSDPEQKTKFYNELAKMMLVFDEELERNNYTEAIAKRYNIDFSNFRKLINHYGAQLLVSDKKIVYDKNKDYKNIASKDTIIKEAQRMLLTWYVEEDRLFDLLKNYITKDDFKEPLYERVATLMFEQHEKEGKVIPAKIINVFEDKEEQSEVARVFSSNIYSEADANGEVKEFMELDSKEKEIYLNQLVKRIKENSIEYDLKNATDMDTLVKCSKLKMELQKMHISLI